MEPFKPSGVSLVTEAVYCPSSRLRKFRVYFVLKAGKERLVNNGIARGVCKEPG